MEIGLKHPCLGIQAGFKRETAAWASIEGGLTVAAPRTIGTHHLRLTVSDLERSLTFYTEVLGFELTRRFGPNSVFLHDGTIGLGLNTPWHDISEQERRFDEARVGLDHIGFKVATA